MPAHSDRLGMPTIPAPLSPSPVVASRGAWPTVLAIAAVIGGMWLLSAHLYRQQNCVYVMGHWLSVHATTVPLLCQ